MAKAKTKLNKVKLKNTSGRIMHVIEVKTKAGEFVSTQRLIGLAVQAAVRKGISMQKMNLRHADLTKMAINNGNFHQADLSNADLSHANMSNCMLDGASFYNAKMVGTILSGSILTNTYLGNCKMKDVKFTHVTGDGEYFKTIQGWNWHIVYTKTHMAIGCKQYKLSEWWAFNKKEIRLMDSDANRFWNKAKPMLQEIIKRNKAD